MAVLRDQIFDAVSYHLQMKKPPRHLNTRALRNQYTLEVAKILETTSPAEGVRGYVAQVWERLIVSGGGATWPELEKWIAAAGTVPAPGADGSAADLGGELSAAEKSFRNFCYSIRNGIGVSEHDLFGRMAERALREQAVTIEQIRAYQVGAFAVQKQVYGRDAAIDWLAARNPVLAEELARKKYASGKGHRAPYADDPKADDPKADDFA